MVDFKIRLAGKCIAVRAIFDSTKAYCRDYLTDEECDFSVEVTEEDLAYEKEKSTHELTPEELSRLDDRHYELTAVYRRIAEQLVDHGIILFHGSCISIDGEAVIFTAKSGTGKSTHTRMWREQFGDRCIVINDDKPLIEVRDDGITVYGTPWNGKHRLSTNTSAPLGAICILERAENNSVRHQSLLAAFPEVFSQTYRFGDPVRMRKTLELLERVMNKVGLYRLGCNLDPSAATVAYNGIIGDKNKNEAEK